MAKIKTNWDLKLLYKSPADPAIEQDLARAEAAYDAFAATYSGRTDYLSDEVKLFDALQAYEQLGDALLGKAYMYFSYQRYLNSKDSKVEAKVNLLNERYTKYANKITFFVLSLGKITPEYQAIFLKSAKLAQYHYFLKCIFDKSKHFLSETEEKLFNRLNLPAYTLWINGNDKLVNQQQIKWKGKMIPLSEAASKIHSLPNIKERHALASLVYHRFKNVSDFAEAELNAVITYKKIDDELRGFDTPYSSVVLGNQNDPAMVENLVDTVTKHFSIAHRFYKTKAKMLGLKQLAYVDRAAPVGKTVKKIEFTEAVEIVRRAFAQVSPIYADTLDQMLQNGQIDVWPKVGKESGAFCSRHETLPIFILLNHLSDFKSVNTLAHEMGHALHSKFSTENQSGVYRDYSLASAEVASTLFENFVFDEVFKTLSPKEQIIALHDKINDSISTIFRQISFFNFELELHNQIRAKGSLSKEDIAKLGNKHNQACLGPLFKFKEEDGYFFVSFPHIRWFFYVYTYAFGEIVSSAMYQKYKEDKSFEQQIRRFLSAGGSASPEDIFASIGIDVRQPKFFELGLKKIEADIEKLEKLVAGKKL